MVLVQRGDSYHRVHKAQPLYRRIRLVIHLILLFALAPLPTLVQTLRPTMLYAQTIVTPPLFSVKHGFFTNSFQLTLSTLTAGATIRYTTDLSTPTPNQGTVYSTPIAVNKTTIVRAIAYTSASNKSITVTQTYIFLADVKSQPANPGADWPNVFAKDDGSGPYPADYEMDPEVVNYPAYANGVFENALRSLPTISLVTDQPNLWDVTKGIHYNQQEKGSAWERAASIELIDPNGGPDFTENAGARIHGQASRRPFRTPKKSFRVYFKAAYGKTKLEFKLFDDNDAESKFDRIVLRGGHNYSWPNWNSYQRRNANYFSDQLSRDVYIAMGHLTPRGDFVHLYLNGLYWGLYNITEHTNEKYLADYTGELETNFDIIEVSSDTAFTPLPEVGDLVKWNELQALVNVSSVSNSVYQQVQQRIDVVELADYIILQHYLENGDWPANNWSTWRVRSGADTRFHIFVWDTESGFVSLNRNITLEDAPDTPAHLFHKLRTNAEFLQLLADRFWLHVTKANGLLTPEACAANVRRLTAMIDQAMIGESARWGDYSREVYQWAGQAGNLPAYLYSRDLPDAYTDPANNTDDAIQTTWLDVRNNRLNEYCLQRSDILTNQYVANGWIQTTLKPPAFSQDGGAIASGYKLAIANTPNANTGDIYYTTNGADPRAFGGGVATAAQNGSDSATLTLTQVTTIKARVLNGSQWSPLYEATFYPPQTFNNLVINELHYNPMAALPANPDDFEYIELFNNGTTTLRLDNVRFTRGFTYQFPLNTSMAPGAYIVLASNAASFKTRYAVDSSGDIRGNLSNGGEAIELSDAVGNVIDSVNYLDVAPWPTAPDGTGSSLALCNPTLDNSLPTSWSASAQKDGTPGKVNGLSCGIVNAPPTVALSSPANNAVFIQGATVTVEATASDDISVTQVLFQDNSAAIAGCPADTTAPYVCSFAPALGSHALTAIASDGGGLTTASDVVAITVVNPLIVSIASPAEGASFVEGTQVTIKAEANDSRTVTKVVFQDNGNPIPGCEDVSAPYECSFTPTAGSHALSAVASDNRGGTATSTAVNITVKANVLPTVSISNPSTGAKMMQGEAITITVTASDTDGVVQQVEFLANNQVICTDTAPPFECLYQPADSGDVQLTARATDDRGGSSISGMITLQVSPKIPPPGEQRVFLPLVTRQ